MCTVAVLSVNARSIFQLCVLQVRERAAGSLCYTIPMAAATTMKVVMVEESINNFPTLSLYTCEAIALNEG